MNKQISSAALSLRLWFLTSAVYSILMAILILYKQDTYTIIIFILPICLFTTIPAFLALWATLTIIKWFKWNGFFAWAFFCTAIFVITLLYGNLNTFLLDIAINNFQNNSYFHQFLLATCFIAFCILTAIILSLNYLQNIFHQTLKNNKMEQNNLLNETDQVSSYDTSAKKSNSNKILIKAFIMGVMILFLLIPTLFITNLVEEREKRQESVVQEVCSKWANEQTIGPPFIYLPYTVTEKTPDNKNKVYTKNLYLLPQDLQLEGKLIPEIRPRSIYKVYLYKSSLDIKGTFKPTIPADIPLENIDFTKAKICFLLNDIKGIDEKLGIQFNGNNVDFAPGLPFKETVFKLNKAPKITSIEDRTTPDAILSEDIEGLSASIPFTKDMINTSILFNMTAKINGSESLRFLPLAANSKFKLNSEWTNPKFDGNKVPSDRKINDSGFEATWNFNSANLPFNTVLKEFVVHPSTYAFGVSLVQPADHYSKTNRCIKYAILFIGLSFSLFFIIEIMQKNPFHPIQYLLVGVALLVFFTLLLSISEFLMFDFAYVIAASAIVLLITLYAKAHFKSIKTAAIFGLFIGGLYSFIFVLIRLEDTALLVGSIGLFIMLSVAMYASRKINWYTN